MNCEPGQNAFAVRVGGEWILKPVCTDGTLGGAKNAIAVRAGMEWILAPVRLPQVPENALSIHAGGGPVLLPIGCEEEAGCSGNDPLCSYCGCEAELSSTYLVSLSGFPNKKGFATFNGVWTLSWSFDCLWICDITSYHRVGLLATAEGGWELSCAIYGGPSMMFGATGTASCAPEQNGWIVTECNETPFNPACPDIWANATASVSRPS